MQTTPDSFRYMAEVSKREFQYTINGLLDFYQHHTEKIKMAKSNNKSGVFLTIKDCEFLCEFILKTVSDLSGHYTILHQSLLHSHKQQRITEAMLALRTPDLLASLLNQKGDKGI